MERRQIRFEGRVQGVGFRATTRWVASEFAVSGWVRNEPDGSVLVQVQGEAGVVDAFLQALRGRTSGHISAEAADRLEPIGGETGFDIQR